MRYRVIGTDLTNRKPIDTVIDAPSLERANMLAGMKKINVSSIVPMDETQPPVVHVHDRSRAGQKSKLVPILIVVILLAIAGYVAVTYLGVMD